MVNSKNSERVGVYFKLDKEDRRRLRVAASLNFMTEVELIRYLINQAYEKVHNQENITERLKKI